MQGQRMMPYKNTRNTQYKRRTPARAQWHDDNDYYHVNEGQGNEPRGDDYQYNFIFQMDPPSQIRVRISSFNCRVFVHLTRGQHYMPLNHHEAVDLFHDNALIMERIEECANYIKDKYGYIIADSQPSQKIPHHQDYWLKKEDNARIREETREAQGYASDDTVEISPLMEMNRKRKLIRQQAEGRGGAKMTNAMKEKQKVVKQENDNKALAYRQESHHDYEEEQEK